MVDFIGIVRDLAERNPPVGVFFESEAIFSLNDDSQLALSFQATMAEEESHTRSRSMESSLRMRLDNGIPLTPKLLGYMHDADGQLIPNPEEAPTVKLAFYMYLYGYSTQQIADAFNALGRKSYLGNINWTSTGIVQILRNERHCGDVLTRKTFTPNFRTHKSKKNKGQRPQSRYRNHHPGIVTRDDFIAVQRMLDNAKYGNKSILPEIRVVEDGVLKGFVTINPRWAGFKEGDYYQASKSVYSSPEEEPHPEEEIRFEVEAGDFDLRGFEIARGEFFDDPRRPHAIIYHKFIKFSTACVRKFGTKNYIEILINPISRKLAIRPTTKENRNSVMAAKPEKGILYPRMIPTSAFSETMFNLLGWNIENKYRILGTLYEQDGEVAYIFDTVDSEAYFKPNVLSKETTEEDGSSVQPLMPSGKRIRAIPESWTSSFGKQFYAQEKSVIELQRQSEADWMLRLEGQLFETGNKLHVTGFEELRSFITQELQGVEI